MNHLGLVNMMHLFWGRDYFLFFKPHCEISPGNRANLTQLDLRETYCISHEKLIDLCFKVKQIQFTLKFHLITWRKKAWLSTRIIINYDLVIVIKNWDQRTKSPGNWEIWLIKVWIIEVQLANQVKCLKNLIDLSTRRCHVFNK